ncbi:MAG: capsule assembly Wzi family protein [Gammaproteobacteria bacterium]|nr:capsule assembly Wzi family protein [Gammaproteobacteria bacterium]MDH3769300.1 capsule assembly Wzi family protein [Gammaproteobacteria bacterium]
MRYVDYGKEFNLEICFSAHPADILALFDAGLAIPDYPLVMQAYPMALIRRSGILVLLLVAISATPVQADTLLLPDDLALRSDIQLLSDAGLLSQPLTGWPLSAHALKEEMQTVNVPAQYRSHIRAAWYRVMNRLQAKPRYSLRLFAIDDPVAMRRYSDTPRGSGARATYHMHGKSLSLRLSATLQERTSDRRSARADGSYAGFRLGKWQLSAGQIPRWWGPSYESSLILSTNARPVPAVALDTIKPIRFRSRWLSWLGGMNWSLFAGKLEGGRFVADANLLGARLSLRPTHKLEIGFSRTAQWGGEGRPEDLDSFINLILGRDNRGGAGITLDNEPGNQLGGVDLRWLSPLGDAPYALYSQFIGEDEAGGLPSRLIGLAGGEYWGGFRGGSFRIYGEVANTTIEFYKSMSRDNLAYEHGIYQDGYRYRGRAIGHAMDNDGLMLSLGTLWNTTGRTWEGLIRRVDVNTDGASPGNRHTVSPTGQDRWELWLASGMPAVAGVLQLGLGVQYVNPTDTATKIDLSVYASWERTWGWGAQ